MSARSEAGEDGSAPLGGSVYKVSGAGNDFLALVEPDRDPTAPEVLAWCARGFAFGADGIFVLRRDGATVRMDHWNSDGGRVELCLNGTRCAARLAFDLGWAEREVTITTGAGAVIGHETGRAGTAGLVVSAPSAPPHEAAPEVAGVRRPGWRIAVGVPHFVILAEGSLADAPVATLGPALRRHPDFGPGGANVDWIRFPDPATMEIRTFERGVEGETLACGTGILAALAVGLHLGICRPPVEARVLGGFALTVDAVRVKGNLHTLSLIGDARILARLELGADAAIPLPAPPRWER